MLAVTAVYFVAELVGGFYANSLALLTDAVHMLTDIAALCLSLLTLWISSRPATRRQNLWLPASGDSGRTP